MLVAFLGLTGLALDRAFRESAITAVYERLKVQIYSVLAAAELDKSGHLTVSDRLPEARFGIPGSGLYAQVNDAQGSVQWRSHSLLGLSIPFSVVYQTGRPFFDDLASDGERLFTMGLAVLWEGDPKDRGQGYTFYVAETADAYNALVGEFRHSLWAWLAGAALVLLAAQGLFLRWGLTPLRRVAWEVAEIEHGRRQRIVGRYPKELHRLTERLNGLIDAYAKHLARYRNALADLAHSLKTPLAVMRGTLGSGGTDAETRQALDEQIGSLHKTIEYQLQRAAAAGRGPLAVPIAVQPVVERLLGSLQKVYADKRLALRCSAPGQVVFHGEEGDLVELLGNVLDNACKWAQHRVEVRAERRPTAGPAGLLLEIEDDGPGIPAHLAEAVMARGVRADPSKQGHGIGLAVVRELVEEVYGGGVELTRGPLGGALVRLMF